MKNDIVVVQLHFNRLEYSKICLNSYFENVKTPHKLILWDNGSRDGTSEFLKSVESNAELLKSLPFQVEFHFSPTNVRWADVINHLWTKNSEASYLGYCPSDMLITGDWIGTQDMIMDYFPDCAVVSDPISNRERQQSQEPYVKYHSSELGGDYIEMVVKDRFGDVPTDCLPSLMRSDLYKKYGPMVEHGGMGCMIFFHGMLRKKGHVVGWSSVKNSELIMYHPLLSFEETQKYKIYRSWLHKFKRGELGSGTPPPDMYSGKVYD